MDVSHIQLITSSLTPWHWMTAGLLLCALELFAPTTIFLWPGIAAILTGLLTLLLPALSWQSQVVMFAILAMATVFAGRQFYKRRNSGRSSLNRRAENLIGKQITLTDSIEKRCGRRLCRRYALARDWSGHAGWYRNDSHRTGRRFTDSNAGRSVGKPRSAHSKIR